MTVYEELYFDKNIPSLVWHSKLPHISQAGKLQSITMRLGDSLPQSKLKEFEYRLELFKEHHPQPWDRETELIAKNLIPNYIQKYLDIGYGSCLFKDRANRDILSSALKYYDCKYYDLLAYVIMPNHIHLLVIEYEEGGLKIALDNLSHFTSRAINKLTGNKGSIWGGEPFDRYIRDKDHLNNWINYIKMNPRYLKEGEYELYFAWNE